ncbi:MAG: hypothetical protein IKE94_06565 [Aeriscardovia sp.]|nr:hypothetical protein [Aeriscardovia sp.]
MTEGIMIAIITGGLAVISNIIIVVFNNTKTIYRIDQLEKKVEKHNNFIERMYVAETEIKEIKDDIQELKRLS